MKKIFTVFIIFMLGLGLGVTLSEAGAKLPGRTQSLVNDYAGVLSRETKAYLENLLRTVRGRDFSGTEIVVSTFASTDGLPTEEFVQGYITRWRRPSIIENDNRIHVILLVEEGKLRMGVGRYAENVITQDVTKDLIANVMIPEIGYGSYNGAVRKGIERIVQLLKEGKLPKSRAFLYARNLFRLVISVLAVLALVFIVRNRFLKCQRRK